MLGAQPRPHRGLLTHRGHRVARCPARPGCGAPRPSCAARAHSESREQAGAWRSGLAAAAPRLLAAAAAGLLLTGQPALADLQTVAPGDATAAARPLKAQSVNKGKVWLLFLGSAFALFGTAVAVERNGALFPAIARANRAMEASKARMKEEQQQEQDVVDVEAGESQRRAEQAVLQGLSLARDKSFQPSSSGPTGTDAPGSSGSSSGEAEPGGAGEGQPSDAAAEQQPAAADAERREGRRQEESVVSSSGKS